MSAAHRDEGREWDYFPSDDGVPFMQDGHLVLGWHDRAKDQDEPPPYLVEAFGRYHGEPVFLRPILVRFMSDVECRIEGVEEGSFIRCTSRARNPQAMWQVEEAPGE